MHLLCTYYANHTMLGATENPEVHPLVGPCLRLLSRWRDRHKGLTVKQYKVYEVRRCLLNKSQLTKHCSVNVCAKEETERGGRGGGHQEIMTAALIYPAPLLRTRMRLSLPRSPCQTLIFLSILKLKKLRLSPLLLDFRLESGRMGT